MSVAVIPRELIGSRDRYPLSGTRRWCKRVTDIAISLAALLLLSPILIACILIIKRSDPGPAIYSQWRVGMGGRLFRIYKLRTMRMKAESESGAVCARPDDERVIACCRWMRRSHVDELPQLINILTGQMSLVGPRPERPEIHTAVTRKLPEFEQRLSVKPGLTGLAQVRNGYTNDLPGCRCKLDYDLQYIQRAGLWMDIKLILSTIPKIWDREAC